MAALGDAGGASGHAGGEHGEVGGADLPGEADVVVVGLGPGGEEVAGTLAQAGLQVVGVEERLVGGECPYWGCVPSKMMLRAADLLAEGRRIPGMAGAATVVPDWAPVAARIRAEATDDWDDRVAVERLTGKGATVVRGSGRLVAPDRVAVGDRQVRARRAVVLATGSQPVVPSLPGLADVPYWTNRQAIETKEVPTSLVVLGGGAVGLELAQVFARFGSRVTVAELADRVLATEEPEASEVVAASLGRDGVSLRTGVRVTAVERRGTGVALALGEDGIDGEVGADRLLVAVGRRVDLRSLGVGAAGVDDGARFVPVDEHLRVAPGIWAVGDVTGKGLFTHMAVYQARIAVADILGRPHAPASYHAVPRVTFTDPEVGAVGLTAAAAADAGIHVRVGTSPLPSSARGWIHKAGNDGVVVVVEDQDRGVLVGATTAGPMGGEMIGLLALAVHAQVPVNTLATMITAYPTFHRAIEPALATLTA